VRLKILVVSFSTVSFRFKTEHMGLPAYEPELLDERNIYETTVWHETSYITEQNNLIPKQSSPG
jgi:hypothetical protein